MEGEHVSRAARAAAVMLALGLLAACSHGSVAPPKELSRPLTVKIGVLVPQSGSSAALGAPVLDAVRVAAADVAAAHTGLTLQIVTADAGSDTSATAVAGAKSLIRQHVSAIIGPRASSQSQAVIPLATAARIPEISPASTMPALTGASPYFFRTAPSDVIQAKALADRIVFDGALKVAIVRVDDDYSTGIHDPLVKALGAAGLEIPADVAVDSGTAFTADEAKGVMATDADAVVVICQRADFVPIATTLQAAGVDWQHVYGTDASLTAALDDPTAPEIQGAVFSSPGVFANERFLSKLRRIDPHLSANVNYAPEAYDAAILVALAAYQADSADGSAIRSQLAAVSGPAGTTATTFAAGASAISAGGKVHYSGLSGPIDFTKGGDPARAYISFYVYGARNHYKWQTQSLEGTGA